MGILANVTPSIKISTRLFYNASVRHYTSLVQVLYSQREDKNLLCHKLAARKFYQGDKTDTTRKQFVRGTELEQNSFDSSIFPIALIDLNPFNIKSSKILLIPLNWHDADEHSMKNTIMSIFSKSKNLKQIEAFSQALKNVSTYQDSTAGYAKLPKTSKKDTHTNYVFDVGKRILKDSHIKNTSNHTLVEKENLDIMPGINNDVNYLDRLTSSVDKALQQCCLHSMQMWSNANIPGKRTKNLIRYSLPLESHKANKTENITKIGESSVILEEIFWNRKISLPELQSSSLKKNTFPVALIKKSYSTKSRSLLQKKLLHAPTKNYKENQAIQMARHNEVTSTIRRSTFSNSTSSKCIANYNFPFLTNLFGTNDLLMSCDAYNKALIEATERRAALAECVKKIGKSENGIYKQPRVTSINSCNDPKQNSQPSVKISDHYPPPMKSKSQTDSGCKKYDPCKPRRCPDPCEDEIEKLQRLKDEEIKRKIKKTPSGCVSPKCKKDNSCTKHKKSPCKTASNAEIYSKIKLPLKNITPTKQIRDNCKLIKCPDPCKDEIKKLKRLENGSIKRKRKNISTGCTCTKCKKEDSCTKRKKSPCKKLHGFDQLQSSLNCAQNKSGCKKGRKKKQIYPSTECDKNSYKKDDSYCGGPKEPHKRNEYGKKEKSCKEKNDPCMKNKDPCKKKEDPCKKENPCTKQDNCGDKKNPCKKEEDPCKKKEDPCKKEEDPCKKKEDPCKKEDSRDSKKENPCKQNPCGSKNLTGPCKSKKDSKTVRESSSSSSNFHIKKSKSSCGKPKGQTNPNCKKPFSTLSPMRSYNTDTLMKRTYTSFINLSLLENKNLPNLDFMRYFSSNGDGKKDKKSEDLGKTSQCNSTATIVPAKRKPAYNPHPKDGLRKCYPTYDMDCKKLCKDAHKTDCKKYAFLKETDNNKRNGKK